MRTLCKTVGKETFFIISDPEPAYKAAVGRLCHRQVDEGFAWVYQTNSPEILRIYENFERYAPIMVLQKARACAVPWRLALLAFLEIIDGHDIDWFLAGSAALAVRGLDLIPGDLDLVVDPAGARQLRALMLDYLLEPPVQVPEFLGVEFCSAFLHVRIEWASCLHQPAHAGFLNEFFLPASRSLETVNWRGFQLRVPPLDIQSQISERRHLKARAGKIKRWMNHQRLVTPALSGYTGTDLNGLH